MDKYGNEIHQGDRVIVDNRGSQFDGKRGKITNNPGAHVEVCFWSNPGWRRVLINTENLIVVEANDGRTLNRTVAKSDAAQDAAGAKVGALLRELADAGDKVYRNRRHG